MSRIYGHRWTSTYDADPAEGAGREWAIGLADLTVAQIGSAVDACRLGLATPDGWPPTLPEFRAVALGVPTVEQVRAQIEGRSPLTPMARAVWAAIDSHRYRHASAVDAERMIARAYAEVRLAVLAGEPLPESPAAELAAPVEPDRVVTPEVAAAGIASIADMLGEARA